MARHHHRSLSAIFLYDIIASAFDDRSAACGDYSRNGNGLGVGCCFLFFYNTVDIILMLIQFTLV